MSRTHSDIQDVIITLYLGANFLLTSANEWDLHRHNLMRNWVGTVDSIKSHQKCSMFSDGLDL